MSASRIDTITVTPIPAFFRGELGKNARRDNIGKSCLEWLVRATTSSHVEGLTIANGYMREFTDFYRLGGTVKGLLEILSEVFLGKRTDEFLEVSGGRVVAVKPSAARAFRDHGWMSILAFDLLGQELGVSCVELLGGRQRDSVSVHDSTLFFQDFLDPESGPAKVAAQAAESHREGYRRFKVSIGRGRRWMLPADGMRRDVKVVLAVREAVGKDSEIMVDASCGYDGHLDLLEDFVRETHPAGVLWMEDLITPSVAGYRALRSIQERTNSTAWLVCGGDDTHPFSSVFEDLCDEGLIDGYQPDVVSSGFAAWQRIETRLQDTEVRSMPDSFGNGNFGTHAGVLFGAASRRFVSAQDEMCVPNVYRAGPGDLQSGAYAVPDGPGLGLSVDEDVFARVYATHEAAASTRNQRA